MSLSINTEWNETQFATESRLKNEVEPVVEIQFTPGTPLFVKGKLSYMVRKILITAIYHAL
ncbi:MAG TPA: hypothetical protein PKD51_12765 [Saprospiraceae bacterium]|nr:hypothetical protein [Saprospiraceae bacterium]HMU02455.1 hypothetical protein [Saprospiraceae bacterium]